MLGAGGRGGEEERRVGHFGGGGHAVNKEHLSLLTQVRFLRRELMGKERWNYK